MADDAQANFEAVLDKILEPKQEVVGAPPVVEQEVVPVMEEDALGLSSLLGGAKEKAGDLFEWYKRFSYPELPDQKEDILSDVQIPPEKPIPPTGEQRAFSRLSIRELNPSAIAGIMGNIDVETAGSFDFEQRQDKGPGYGLFQFEEGHQEAYQSYLKNNNEVDSPEAQIDYVLDNILKGTGHDIGHGNRLKLQKIFESGSPEEIALQFSRIFERPQQGSEHNERRMESAKQRFESITGNKRGGMIFRNPYPHNPRPI